MREHTEIVMVMDKSGSMAGMREDAIGSFNTFLKEQQKVKGSASLTLVLFDTTYKVVYLRKPIKEAPELTDETYRPGGNTALLDATARAIVELGAALDELDDDQKPNRVIVCIITDGQENSSREHTNAQVKEMITHQEENYDWDFTFLGAGPDTFDAARGMGIKSGKVMLLQKDSARSYGQSIGAFSSNVAESRTSGGKLKDYSIGQRNAVNPDKSNKVN